MNDIVRYWPYMALAARREDDRIKDNNLPNDFIETTLNQWHKGEIHHIERFTIPTDKGSHDYDYSYLVELGKDTERRTIIAHLGTDNNSGWWGKWGNVWGTLRGLLFPFYGMNPAFGKPGFQAYKKINEWFDCHPHAKMNPVVNVMHSRGGRGMGMALFFVQLKFMRMLSIGYCIPPVFTKKGLSLCDKYGINRRTQIVVSPGDPVDNAGFLKYKHCVSPMELRRNREWITSNIPLGSHSYSAVTHNLIETFKDDSESVEYLLSRSFVDEK